MPSIIVHHLFAEKVLKKIENNNNNLKRSQLIYQTFSQSHDYLYYYKSFNIKYYKEINELGHIAHRDNTQEYFINLISHIKNNNLQNDSDIMGYLYGSLTHYILDANCHPFIFYKTGTYHKNNPNTKKYHGEHSHIEKDLDAYYYQLYYKKSYKYCNVSKSIIKKPFFSKSLINTINETYKKTYNEENIGNIYIKSIKIAKIIHTLLINDRFGIKKAVYKTIDKLTNKKFGNLSSYSTYVNNPNLNFLNLEHKVWNHPCDKKITYKYSFNDLIDISYKECITIIKAIEDVLYKNKDISILLKIIPNRSYLTGLPLDHNKRMCFFEY